MTHQFYARPVGPDASPMSGKHDLATESMASTVGGMSTNTALGTLFSSTSASSVYISPGTRRTSLRIATSLSSASHLLGFCMPTSASYMHDGVVAGDELHSSDDEAHSDYEQLSDTDVDDMLLCHSVRNDAIAPPRTLNGNALSLGLAHVSPPKAGENLFDIVE